EERPAVFQLQVLEHQVANQLAVAHQRDDRFDRAPLVARRVDEHGVLLAAVSHTLRYNVVIRRALDKMRSHRAPAAPEPAGSPDPAPFFPVALLHLPMAPVLAPIVMLDADAPDERSMHAARRVIDAWHAAMQSAQAQAPSMWGAIEEQHAEFFAAVRKRDVAAVQKTLARLFHTHLIWGLGRVHPLTPVHIAQGQPEGVQIQVTDALVSLAEATGAARITCIEQQGVPAHLDALRVDVDALLD